MSLVLYTRNAHSSKILGKIEIFRAGSGCDLEVSLDDPPKCSVQSMTPGGAREHHLQDE